MFLREFLDNHRRRTWLIVFPSLLGLAATLSAVAMNVIGATQQRDRAESWHVHTLEVLLATGEMKTAIYSALRGERGYLLTSNAIYLRPYLTARAESAGLVTRLSLLTRDNSRQQTNVQRLRVQLRAYLAHLDRTVSLADAGRLDEAVNMVRLGAGRSRTEAVLGVIDAIEAEEYRLLAARRLENARAKAQSERISELLLAIAVLVLLLLIWASIAALRANERAARATAELRRLATTDELTGLANRRSFLDALEREAARAWRSGHPLCLAMVDLDHFKKINDHYGHPAGDEVLRKVAEVLTEGTRLSDTIGRLGGEEFAILMPETDLDQALRVCERLCRFMALSPIEFPGGISGRVTFSSGVAVLSAGEPGPDLLSRADAALYEAKFGGRNQVKLAA